MRTNSSKNVIPVNTNPFEIMKTIFYSFLLVGLFIGCEKNNDSTVNPTNATNPDNRDAITGEYVGEHYFIYVKADSNNQFTILDTTISLDTAIILKDTNSDNIVISGFGNYNVEYDFNNLKFGNISYTYGNFLPMTVFLFIITVDKRPLSTNLEV